MSSFDDDGQNGDIGWIHARNPSRLCKCLRFELFELLAAFISDRLAGIVIKPARNTNGLVLLGSCGGDFLLADVTRVVLANPQLFNDGEYLLWRKREFGYMVLDKFMDHVDCLALLQVVGK